MPRFVLASHGHLAEGMKDTLQIILGQLDNVETLCAYIDPDVSAHDQVEELLWDSYRQRLNLLVLNRMEGDYVPVEGEIETGNWEAILLCNDLAASAEEAEDF